MKNPLKTPAAASLGLLLARLPLGVIFVVAAFTKFQNGVGNFVSSSASSIPSYLPHRVGEVYLYLLPATELIVGVMLVLGWFSRTAGFVCWLILVSILLAKTGFWEWPFPHRNVVLLGIALLVTLNGAGSIAMDSVRFRSGGGATKPKRAE